MLREPAFNDSDFEQVKQQRIAAIEANLKEPGSLASEVLRTHISSFPRTDVRHVETMQEEIADLISTSV